MPSVYSHVGGLHPKRSAFNTSFSTLFNCDMGQLIPIYYEECIPGDFHDISVEHVVRFQPLTAPILHEIYARTMFFFVAFRNLMNRETVEDLGDTGEWEDFITGGRDGLDTTELPLWKPPVGGYGKYSLWDYFGFPLNVVPTKDSLPHRLCLRAYNESYNEYIRDQNLQDPVSLDDDTVKNICWSKDRFTTALYDTQRGSPVAIPFDGLGKAEWSGLTFGGSPGISGNAYIVTDGVNDVPFPYQGDNIAPRLQGLLNGNTIDLSEAGGIGISDLRRVVQLQKLLERNMRVGSRYTEQLEGRFGVKPQDFRLQRPEFIGATRTPVIISEVLNTTGTADRPQGDLAGHGITAAKTRIGKYHAKEHGCIIGLMVVQPVPVYNLGINKKFQRRTRFDFPTPELVNLSEIAVKNSELVVTGTARDDEIFGYQGIYDEMRINESRVCGDLRNGEPFEHWSLARDDYDKDNPPSLNENFVKCVPTKRIFEVQNEPGLIVHCASLVRSVRPLPLIAQPGLVDHH